MTKSMLTDKSASDNSNELSIQNIHPNSRAQALEEGALIDVSETADRVGFSIPVAVTYAVWGDYIGWSRSDYPEWAEGDSEEQTIQDAKDRLWDVLTMLKFAIRNKRYTSGVIFELMIVSRKSNGKPERTRLKGVIDLGANAEPALTIMLPSEG